MDFSAGNPGNTIGNSGNTDGNHGNTDGNHGNTVGNTDGNLAGNPPANPGNHSLVEELHERQRALTKKLRNLRYKLKEYKQIVAEKETDLDELRRQIEDSIDNKDAEPYDVQPRVYGSDGDEFCYDADQEDGGNDGGDDVENSMPIEYDFAEPRQKAPVPTEIDYTAIFEEVEENRDFSLDEYVPEPDMDAAPEHESMLEYDARVLDREIKHLNMKREFIEDELEPRLYAEREEVQEQLEDLL
ncbi:uncharacterized protein LOC131621699 [Vicia villosa]|uniref:uncharacterized protein LOC131621699 n=1 Tax=Vicia villosa TaxID=3911 RepID=UPI00273C4F9A|nr:uncharacterized protein LOC131621699 [Vicia villosa]